MDNESGFGKMVLISISSQNTQETVDKEIEEKGYESPTTGSMSPLVRELRHFY